jgi:hypothetical protein
VARGAVRPVRLVRALPLAFLAVVGALLALRWDRIPGRFPVHWGLTGAPDRWAERSALAAFGPLAAGAVLLVAMLALGRRRSAPGERRGKAPGGIRAGEGALLGASYAIAAALGAAAARPLLAGERPWPVLVAAGMGFLLAPLLVALAALRRRG